MQKKEKNLASVLKDKVFLKKVIEMTMEDAQKAFKERGVELSKDDMITINNLVDKQLNGSISMPENELQYIGGGIEITEKIKNISIAIAALIVAGSAVYAVKNVAAASDKVSSASDNLSVAAANLDEVVDKVRDPEKRTWFAKKLVGSE